MAMGVWAHYILFKKKLKSMEKNPCKLNCSYYKVPHALKYVKIKIKIELHNFEKLFDDFILATRGKF